MPVPAVAAESFFLVMGKSRAHPGLTYLQVSDGTLTGLRENPRMGLAKDPIRAAGDERDHGKTKPEPPKPDGMPEQLRFGAGDSDRQIVALLFQSADLRGGFAELVFEPLALRIGAQRQLQLLADLQIALRHPGIEIFDIFVGNVEGRRDGLKRVAGSHLPELIGGGRRRWRSY